METRTNIDKDKKVAIDYKNIPGWGMDADPDNDPTYPMKHVTGDDHQRLNYERAPQQAQNIEVLHSNERPGITRVFGTSTPPKGLSGQLRRFAFRFSEGSSGHWLTLLLADRVNVVEGIVEDFTTGHFPNFVKERGWTAEFKYNKKQALQNVGIGLAITTAVVALMVLQNKKKKSSIRQAY